MIITQCNYTLHITLTYFIVVFSHVVVDAAMTEVIRPALYNSYHHISLASTNENSGILSEEQKVYDVVGPVCESTDFLAKVSSLCVPNWVRLAIWRGQWKNDLSHIFNILSKSIF